MRTGAGSAPEGIDSVGLPKPVPATRQPEGPQSVAQPPGAEQVSVGLEHVSVPPPPQEPAWQVLPLVQASPSSQAVPSVTFVVPQLPSGLQRPTVQGLPVSAGHWTAAPRQTPCAQASAVVQPFPSLQDVPSATFTAPQVPSDRQTAAVQGLPVPGHCFGAPAQTPAVQTSPVVQELPSLQEAPSAAFTATQVPLA
jgi:hypothetical protein